MRQPAGVACGWALMYAAGFAIIAVATLLVATPWRLDTWRKGNPVPATCVLWAIVATAILFTIALVVAAPWLPARAKRQLARNLRALAKAGALRPTGEGDTWEQALHTHLQSHALSYAYLFREEEDELILTEKGIALASWLQKAAADT